MEVRLEVATTRHSACVVTMELSRYASTCVPNASLGIPAGPVHENERQLE